MPGSIFKYCLSGKFELDKTTTVKEGIKTGWDCS